MSLDELNKIYDSYSKARKSTKSAERYAIECLITKRCAVYEFYTCIIKCYAAERRDAVYHVAKCRADESDAAIKLYIAIKKSDTANRRAAMEKCELDKVKDRLFRLFRQEEAKGRVILSESGIYRLACSAFHNTC